MGTPVLIFWETAKLAVEKTSGSRDDVSAGLAEPPAEVPLSDKSSRKSSAGDSRPGRDAHALAADRGMDHSPGV